MAKKLTMVSKRKGDFWNKKKYKNRIIRSKVIVKCKNKKQRKQIREKMFFKKIFEFEKIAPRTSQKHSVIFLDQISKVQALVEKPQLNPFLL